MARILTVVAAIALLGACQAPPQIAQLQSEKAALQKELMETELQVETLQRREAELQERMDELERISRVLSLEKTSRAEQSSELRQQVRQFVQQQIDDLKRFLVDGDLLDYIGSELVQRSLLEPEPLTLVDLKHPIPRAGSLTGVTGHFSAPTKLRIKVLRPLEERYMVIWESAFLQIPQEGLMTVQLPVTVGVEPGDVVAYAFPEAANVSFDRGTGDTRYTDRELQMGQTLELSSLSGEEEKRAYSLGVYAILE